MRVPRSGRSALLAMAAAVAVATALTSCSSPPVAVPIVGPDGSGLFGDAAGVWHQQLPADAPVDPRSAEYVHQLLSDQKPLVSVNGWTVAVYDADAKTPHYQVGATSDFVKGGWTLPSVPIPDEAHPDPQEDGHMVVVDHASQCVYEFWQARHSGTSWSASWVDATPADGTGVYPDGLSARASGLSAAAGLIWPQELAAGRIDHTLVFASKYTARGGPVPPATKSDGQSDQRNALPEGARLRLDPTLDLDNLGLTPQEHTIAVALQQYGMVLADNAGGFTLYAANPQSYVDFPYPLTWVSDLWADVSRIPFDRLQVLTLPPQAGNYVGPPVTNRCTADAVHTPDAQTGSQPRPKVDDDANN